MDEKVGSLTPDPVPTLITLDYTLKSYRSEIAEQIRRLPPQIRGYLRTNYLGYLKRLDPDSVIDAIETDTTVMDKYKGYSFRERAPIAAARGFLRMATEKTRNRVRAFISYDIALLTVRFENSLVYQVIKSYGERGEAWLRANVAAFLEIMKLEA